MTTFSTILVANRGEIAVRILRTARDLGYRTVAVYSDADATMPHVGLADRAVHLGASPAADSYLNIGKLIDAARRSGAGAVHPGYGFLSESAEFAEACAAAGLVFIGPPAAAIRAMGNKANAKRLMAASGVPYLPGYDGAAQDIETLKRHAAVIGYPVMLKATDGGGGKGMRLITAEADLADGLALAASEARKAFGSDRVMLEKAVIAPRHVEVQVFADAHGNVVHLGDRDCSIQRRHQKIIEEAPAPHLDPALRARMAEAAVAAARAVDYRGAGTVEFLVERGGFYFLEMNTRLQVEHPVTEMVTGLDLVEWQILVAAGAPLPKRQDEIAIRGHAIESRLYAEDPETGFLPQSGRIAAWRPPVRAGVRVDHGLAAGATVSTFYDPMIAKVIGFGPDRETARRRSIAAIEDFFVAGLRHNQSFLLDCLAAPAFASADLGTDFIGRHVTAERATAAPDTVSVAIAAALFATRHAAGFDPALQGWRSAPWENETLTLESGEWSGMISMTRGAGGAMTLRAGATATTIVVIETGEVVRVTVDGVAETVFAAWQGDELFLSRRGAVHAFRERTALATADRAAASRSIARAPMPGVVARVDVACGDRVAKGDVLLVLEAMKMEHLIVAPVAGTVAVLSGAVGQQVPIRHPLVEIEIAGAAP